MFELTLHTEVTIDSAHQLKGYEGKCAQLHGHTWKIELWFKGSNNLQDNVGILFDFGIVKQLKEILDHKNINDVMADINPTAENLVQWVYWWLHDCWAKHKDSTVDIKDVDEALQIKVRVYETAVDKLTWCEGGDF